MEREDVSAVEMDVRDGALTRSRKPEGKDCLAKETTPGASFVTAVSHESSLNAISTLLDRTVDDLDFVEREKLEVEIRLIPDHEKKEYLDAVRLASSFVIEKEANPFMFFLIENHQYDKAARRMIDYWKNRKKMFGDRAFRSVFDLSGNGALSLEELEPFRKSLEHVILPSDKMGRTVLYFDDEFLDSTYYRDAYGDTRQRILFLLLNFIALTNMPISQREGFVTIRVIRRENYDLTKAVKHGSLLTFMPLISNSIHFCGVPPKGARRYFKDYLVPLLVGSSESESDRSKEKMANALDPFPILSKFHMSSKRQSIAAKLEECDLLRTGIPMSLGGEWSSVGSRSNTTNFDSQRDSQQSNVLSIWSLIIKTVSNGSLESINGLDPNESENSEECDHEWMIQVKNRHDRTKHAANTARIIVSQEDYTWSANNSVDVDHSQQQKTCDVSQCDVERQMEQECKPLPAPCSGFKFLSKEANEAIVQQRKRRKRQMDVIYARHRRSRDRCEVMILQERVAFISQSNRVLNEENVTLTKLLIDARAVVARFELESNILNSRLLMNANAPDTASSRVSELDFLKNSLVGPKMLEVAVNLYNQSISSFAVSDYQGNLPSVAPVPCLLQNPCGLNIQGHSVDTCLVQQLLEKARNNESILHSGGRLMLAPRSNTSLNVASLDHLCDSHVLLPALLRCQSPALLLSQLQGRQPCPPEVQFPGLISERSNVLSARVHEELLQQLRFLAAQRRP